MQIEKMHSITIRMLKTGLAPLRGEVFVNDSDIEEYENEMLEKRNYRELKDYFKKESGKLK